MDGVELDGTSTDGYSHPSEADLEELFLEAASDAFSSTLALDEYICQYQTDHMFS